MQNPDIKQNQINIQLQLQQETDYYRCYKILQKMLVKKLITAEEFNKIDALNRESFLPNLAQIMA